MTGTDDNDRLFPEDWYHYEKYSDSSGSLNIACFKLPDYSKFPDGILKDHNFFNRLLLTMRDLSHVNSAIAFMRQDIDWDEQCDLGERRRFQSYETSLIVSYARPFSETVGEIPRLSFKTLGIKLSDYTRDIHNDLIKKRNKIFAHSDFDAVEFAKPVITEMTRPDGSKYSILYPPRFREGTFMGEAELERVSLLSSCLFNAVMKLAQEMHVNFIDRYETREFPFER